MTQTEAGIMKAVVYADLFDFPLTADEIYLWFIGKHSVEKKVLLATLVSLVEQRLLDQEKGLYFLPGKNQLCRLRKSRLRFSTTKYLRAKRIALWLSNIPWVVGIFLTGTAAVDNATTDDDIDLMIITKQNRLWSTRLLVTSILDMLGIRRKPGQEEVQDSFCVNLYLDEAAMTVPDGLKNLYTAHEVVLSKVLYEKEDVSNRFVRANRWIKNYLPNTPISSIKHMGSTNVQTSMIERLCYWMQKQYMLRKMTREIIAPKHAYFHPKDMAALVLSKYDQALKHYDVE